MNSACLGSVTVTNLRCEYLTNPLGIDTPAPRLSWALEGKGRGLRQTAYQIIAASSEEILSKGQGDLWDTDMISSSQQNQIPYQGKTLGSNRLCFWKVRVWDQDGNPSKWSESAIWSMGLLKQDDWQAKWIRLKSEDQETYKPGVHVRKEIDVRSGINRAVLHVTAAGVYEFYINGKPVGEDVFSPGWTEYDKRLFYQTYDVTDLLKAGKRNALGAILGDGWYGLHHGGRGLLSLKAQLLIEYKGGSYDLVYTDESWTYTEDGPLRMSDMYQGETYDARREMPGWASPGFDDAGWKRVSAGAFEAGSVLYEVTDKLRAALKDNALSITVNNKNFGDPAQGVRKVLRVVYAVDGAEHTKVVGESGTLEIRPGKKKLEIVKAEYGAAMPTHNVMKAVLQRHPGNPVRKTAEIETVEMTEPKPGEYVFDMGQNFAGWARLKVKGEAGTQITMRFAEMLNPDGTVHMDNLRSAACTDRYTLKGDGVETWEPRFTFHGFRYVQVSGYPGKPSPDALTGVVLNSDAHFTSEFECSNAMLNQLHSNIEWGQRSNYLEVPTDCPQRNERLGWSGDAQVFIGTGTYFMDVAAFFTAWLTTFEDSQSPEGGFANASPKHIGVSPGWGDAGVICPWTIYRMYGDKRILEKHYESMAKWIEYLHKRSKGFLRPDEGYGDWLAINASTPKDVISTAYFAYSTDLMAQIATVLGKEKDAARYRDLAGKIREAFINAYVDERGHIKGDTQTCYLMALGFDLLPDKLRPLAADRLVHKLAVRNDHLAVGFLGVNLILPVLRDIGRTDLAYKLLQNDTFPSWGYSIKNGATTIWERWNGWTEAKGFHESQMNSFNHYAYGSCGQWMFDTMVGIAPETVGFEEIVIRPRVGGGITQVEGSYDSIRGPIEVEWEIEDGELEIKVEIPPNCTAKVYVPARNPKQVKEGGKKVASAQGVTVLKSEDGCAVFQIGSGEYEFSVPIQYPQ